ncbi:MAG: hypothetical protein K9N06_01920 [Candidatus Cloacimonetes bacterium]|nr:hypothetical protein [Candidatus Cloacimonadota bacterium]
MKRIIFVVILVALVGSLFAGRSATPHPVYIELHDSEGNLPNADSLEVNCWLNHKPEQILTMEDSNILYPIKDVFLQIQCSGFNSWDAGDTLHVEVTDKLTQEFIKLELELNFDNYQLFPGNHLQKPESKE